MSRSKLKIPAHVFGYSLALVPPVLYAYYYQSNKPNEQDFEEELRKNYSHNIEKSSKKKADMVKFMNALKRGENDERMDEVLHAGKGEMKRHYKVDGRFYGTEEGVAAKKQMEDELRNKKKEKKKKKEAAAAAAAAVTLAAKGEPQSTSDGSGSETGDTAVAVEDTDVVSSGTTESVVAIALIGALASAAILLVGGGRSQ